MLEIQDAANVITESIDPDAKVIFGAINDNRLKKDEVKVTVIASGFTEGKNIRRPSLFQSSPGHESPPVEKETTEEAQTSIPAFLRRKK